MKQWDVVMFPFSKEKRHPAVILSNDETCQNHDIEEVNALLCTSAKVNREPKLTEEVLDESAGLIGRRSFVVIEFIFCPRRNSPREKEA